MEPLFRYSDSHGWHLSENNSRQGNFLHPCRLEWLGEPSDFLLHVLLLNMRYSFWCAGHILPKKPKANRRDFPSMPFRMGKTSVTFLLPMRLNKSCSVWPTLVFKCPHRKTTHSSNWCPHQTTISASGYTYLF